LQSKNARLDDERNQRKNQQAARKKMADAIKKRVLDGQILNLIISRIAIAL
jgi:hypothetical protein